MRCCRTVARSTCYSDDSPSLSQYVTKALLRQNSNPLGEGKSSQAAQLVAVVLLLTATAAIVTATAL